MNANSVWTMICLAFCVIAGCCEIESDAYNAGAGGDFSANAGALRSMAEKTTDEHLIEPLVGTWDGLGCRKETRMEFREDGTYTMFYQGDDRWIEDYDGEFWVEIEEYRGADCTVMHMTHPDSDDYPVRYHFEGDVIYFEEPNDFEPAMRYQKVTVEE